MRLTANFVAEILLDERKLSRKDVNTNNSDDSLFKYSCDASDYQPGELDVKIDGEELIITGEHKKEDNHQSVHRSFTRRVALPKNIKKETIECNVGPNGQLNVTAELIKPEKQQEQTTIKIPIKLVGEKSIEVEKAKEATTSSAEEKKEDKEVQKE
uniref:SHSP domain-containing protein n=1 Tax=Meloidogyne hapla TaxID=6305 RepID=A0A1I8BNS6_MELHA